MEKFTPLASNFTLPPGLTGWTNFTSVLHLVHMVLKLLVLLQFWESVQGAWPGFYYITLELIWGGGQGGGP